MKLKEYKTDSLSAEQKKETLAALNYIQLIAHNTRQDITRWELDDLFGDKNVTGYIKYKTKEEKDAVNEKFFKRMNNLVRRRTETKAKSLEKVVLDTKIIDNLKVNIRNSLAAQNTMLTHQLRDQRQRANDYLYNYNNALNKIAELENQSRTYIAGLETVVQDKTFSIINQLNKILKEGKWTNPVLDRNYLYLETSTDVINVHKNKASGLDVLINLGVLSACIDLNLMDVRIVPRKNNVFCPVRHYFHPHIFDYGTVCWGTAQQSLNKWKKDYDIFNMLEAVHSILMNYNDHNPYINIVNLKQNAVPMTEANRASICDRKHPQFEPSKQTVEQIRGNSVQPLTGAPTGTRTAGNATTTQFTLQAPVLITYDPAQHDDFEVEFDDDEDDIDEGI